MPSQLEGLVDETKWSNKKKEEAQALLRERVLIKLENVI